MGDVVRVLAADYRLAPEAPFPAAADDAAEVLRYAIAKAEDLGIDPARIALGGDSAGGNLAAAVCLMSRDRSGPALALQVLAYPVTQYNLDTRSYRDYADGYLLTRNSMRWFWDHYLQRPEDGAQPYASPLSAPNRPSRCPATEKSSYA